MGLFQHSLVEVIFLHNWNYKYECSEAGFLYSYVSVAPRVEDLQVQVFS